MQLVRSPPYGGPRTSRSASLPRTLPCTQARSTGGLALLAPSHAIKPSNVCPRLLVLLLLSLVSYAPGLWGCMGGREVRVRQGCLPCPMLAHAHAALPHVGLLLLLLLKRTRMRVECASNVVRFDAMSTPDEKFGLRAPELFVRTSRYRKVKLALGGPCGSRRTPRD